MVLHSKILWNSNSPISLERIEWFCWFFGRSSYILLYLTIEAAKICYFGLALSGIGPKPIRLPDVLNLKTSKTIWVIKFISCFHWSKKISCYFELWLQNVLGQSICRIFTLDLFDLLILIPVIQCYIVLV